jgi:hypothetical protein
MANQLILSAPSWIGHHTRTGIGHEIGTGVHRILARGHDVHRAQDDRLLGVLCVRVAAFVAGIPSAWIAQHLCALLSYPVRHLL